MSTITDPRAAKRVTIPKRRQDLLKWNGWGYKDTNFHINPTDEQCEVTGDRYKISGNKLPLLKDWFIGKMGASTDRKSLAQPEMSPDKIPNVIMNDFFMQDIKRTKITYSDEPHDRLLRAHGIILVWIVFLSYMISIAFF